MNNSIERTGYAVAIVISCVLYSMAIELFAPLAPDFNLNPTWRQSIGIGIAMGIAMMFYDWLRNKRDKYYFSVRQLARIAIVRPIFLSIVFNLAFFLVRLGRMIFPD